MDYLEKRPDPETLKPGDKVICSERYSNAVVFDSLVGSIFEIKEVDPNFEMLEFDQGLIGTWEDYIRVEDALEILNDVANKMQGRMLELMKIVYGPKEKVNA